MTSTAPVEIGEFERLVDVFPSRDWRTPEPYRDYGVTCVSMTFTLKGPKGAVYWEIGTEWAIEPVRKHLARFPWNHEIEKHQKPDGRRLGYHSPSPLYDDQHGTDGCQILGGRCYTDCTFTGSDDLIEGFLAGGTEWLWPKLEEYYRNTFEAGPEVDFSPHYLPHPALKDNTP